MDDHSFILESPLLPLVERSFDGIALARPNPWRIVYANAILAAWLKWSVSDLPARRLEELILTSPASRLLDAISAVWQGCSPEETISGHLTKCGGRPTPVELRLVRSVTPDDALLGIIVRKIVASQAPSTAASAERRDPLTGITRPLISAGPIRGAIAR
jgi:hypothetical protein